jgi:hypothetical protein
MTKYRVKEIEGYSSTYYVLQERFLLVFWRTLECWDEFEFPIPYGCPHTFSSKGEAIGYIQYLKRIKETEKERNNHHHSYGSNIVAKLDKNGNEVGVSK